MNKRLTVALLALLLLALSACSGEGAVLHPVLNSTDTEGRSRQFGQTDAVVLSMENFSYVVLYPKTGIEALDTALLGWAQATVDDAVNRRSMSDDGRLGGELMVSYDSYIVNERLVSIALTGSYVSRGTAPPFEIAYTLTFDLLENRVVPPIELMPFTSHPQMFGLVEQKLLERVPELDVDELGVNSLWLEPIVLTAEDVRLIVSGERNPLEHIGESALVFSYEELEGILFLPGRQSISMSGEPLPPPPATEPEATQPVQVDPDKPMIALTFDDGPSKITDGLLDLLARYNVHATFFMIGRQVPDYPETVKRMFDDGHELASHTWDHPELNRLSAEAVTEQFVRTSDAIEAAAGVRPSLLRPPYGAANAAVREVATAQQLYLVNWSVDTLDWKSRNAQAVYEHIMANAKDGSIILCHDLYQSTLEAMELAIPALLEQGYQLVTAGQLLGLEQDEMVFGTIYRQR